jgi:hypothetical protein
MCYMTHIYHPLILMAAAATTTIIIIIIIISSFTGTAAYLQTKQCLLTDLT